MCRNTVHGDHGRAAQCALTNDEIANANGRVRPKGDIRTARERTLRLAAKFESNGRFGLRLRSFKFPECGRFP